jgi:trimethylamine--corrinoid protein Co-methyltransferase
MMGIAGGQYRPLGDRDVKAIHEAALELLTEVGISVYSDSALEFFRDIDADVDTEERRVRIPYSRILEAIRVAPKDITLYSRDGKSDLYLSGKRVHMGTGGVAMDVVDEHNEKRRAQLQDIKKIAVLIDYLDNIHFDVIPVYPDDLEADEVDVNRFFSSIQNTTKHVMGGIFTMEGLERTIEMASMIAGSKEDLVERPFLSFIACVMSPLKIDGLYGDLLIAIAREGLPVAVPAEPITGLTSPITLAGNVTVLHAETLAKIVLAQFVNPGTPVIYGCTASSSDLKTLGYITGSVEMGLINAAAAQMAQYLELPNYTTSGMSDSKVVDAQNGYEKALTSALVALAGSTFIHDSAGLVEFAMTASYKQYVIDNEINGMVMRAVSGIDVNEDTIAMDVFKDVGPGGHFIAHKHTSAHLREEHYIPTISDRQKHEEWEKSGSWNIERRALDAVAEVLAEHEPVGLGRQVEEKVQEAFPEVRL